jgi:thiamine kinase-like enzyme
MSSAAFSHPPNDAAAADASLAALCRELWPGGEVEIQRVDGGMTNRNFKIAAAGGTYMAHVQLPDQFAGRVGIDRNRQFRANQIAAGLEIAPAIVSYRPDLGIMIADFIAGPARKTGDLGRKPEIARVAAMLRRLHAAPHEARLDAWISHPFDGMNQLLALAEAADSGMVSLFTASLAIAREMEAHRRDWTPALTHVDLSAGNLVGDDALMLVDWEYAGNGDPLYDLGDFFAKNELTDDQIGFLLAEYKAAPGARDFAVVKLYGVVSLLREAFWAIGMSKAGFSEFDHREYAMTLANRLRLMLAEPWVGDALAQLKGH